MILEQGGIEFRDAIADLMVNGEFGSDDTAEDESDTGLGTPIATSAKAVAIEKSGLSIQATHELLSTEANSTSFKEFAIQTSAKDLTRVTTTTLDKDNTEEVITITTFDILIN